MKVFLCFCCCGCFSDG